MVTKTLGKCNIFYRHYRPKPEADYFTGKASLNYPSPQDLVNHYTATFLPAYSIVQKFVCVLKITTYLVTKII